MVPTNSTRFRTDSEQFPLPVPWRIVLSNPLPWRCLPGEVYLNSPFPAFPALFARPRVPASDLAATATPTCNPPPCCCAAPSGTHLPCPPPGDLRQVTNRLLRGVRSAVPVRRRPRPERQLGLPLIRGRILKVRQDLRDELRLLDAGNHLELPAAVNL